MYLCIYLPVMPGQGSAMPCYKGSAMPCCKGSASGIRRVYGQRYSTGLKPALCSFAYAHLPMLICLCSSAYPSRAILQDRAGRECGSAKTSPVPRPRP